MDEYVWGVMVLSTIVQCLLLLGTSRLCRVPVGVHRILLGGGFSGVYTGLCLLPQYCSWADPICRVAVFVAIGMAVFGITLTSWQRTSVFILLNMALEGIAAGLDGDDIWRYAPALVMLGLLCIIGFLKRPCVDRYVPLKITYAGRSVEVTALQDTGNLLTDPLTGQQVLIISPDVAGYITGLTQQQLRAPLETLRTAKIPGLRLLPYRTVGQGGAFLLALRMQVRINRQTEHYLVALAPEVFGREEAYQALTGGVM